MQFKAVSWAMGYVFLAKGNGKLFFTMEVIAGLVILAINLLFYNFFGMNGLGISFTLTFFVGILLYYTVLNRKYDFWFPRSFVIRVLMSYGIVVVSFSTVFISDMIYRYIAGIVVLGIAAFFSYKKLNEEIDFKSFILSKLKRK
jgi:PST family polysaccharide transporter